MKNVENVKIYLQDKNIFRNEFHYKKLSQELNDYVLSECKAFNPKKKLQFTIYSKEELNNDEKMEFITMFHNNFKVEMAETYRYFERITVISLLCLLIGIIFLFIYMFLNNVPIIFSEVILIIVWVFIWEGVYNLFFGRIKHNLMINRLKKLTTCKIIFSDKKE